MAQLSRNVTSARKLHVSDSKATYKQLASILEKHASDSCVRYARACEWLASKRRLAGKKLH